MMENYRSMDYKLSAKVADAVNLLIEAQKEAEEAYMSISSELDEVDKNE